MLKYLVPFILVTSCTIDQPSYEAIYWSDGDSGKLGSLKFRLANVDAPETGGVGGYGGAKCEAERELGRKAKSYMISQTKSQKIIISHDYGEDRYGRLVVDLSIEGRDLVDQGLDAGHLRRWPHLNGRSLAPKPDWCD